MIRTFYRRGKKIVKPKQFFANVHWLRFHQNAQKRHWSLFCWHIKGTLSPCGGGEAPYILVYKSRIALAPMGKRRLRLRWLKGAPSTAGP